MDATREKTKVSMGDNLTIARKWKKITQNDLAEKVGLHQTEISTLEKQYVIDADILERIAKAMDIPVDFFTEFDMEEETRSYNNTNTNNITAAENSSEWVNSANTIEEQNNINEQQVTYYPLDDVKALYERLLKEKETQYELLNNSYQELKRKFDALNK